MTDPYTAIPNWLIEAMPQMPASTFQVAVFIARQTVGYSNGNGGRKEWDRISVSQFQKATGLSRQGTQDAIILGLGKWFIRREAGQSFEYQLCNSVDHSTELTMQLSRTEPCNSVERLDPKLCNSVDPQKKEIKEKKERSSPPAAATDDDGHFPRALIEALHERRFMYLDRDPIRLADNLIEDFGMEQCLIAADIAAKAHLVQISKGQRGIMAPLAYMRSTLGNGATPINKQPKRVAYITDPVTGEQREVMA